MDGHPGSHAHLAFQGDAAPLGIDQAFSDRKTQAVAAAFIFAGLGDLVKTLENVRNVFRRDAATAVGYYDFHEFGLRLGTDRYAASLGGMPQRVVEQNQDHLAQASRVTPYNARWLRNGKRDALCFGQPAELF